MAAKTMRSKNKPTKIEEMSKEQIRQAIIKKRECNARAQSIVESLLETSVTENFLLECLPEINRTHFEDVIEERSIIHLCGYPLCSIALSQKEIPKQKYKISVKTNKVYDITARKRFCSNACYKSAMHLKKQMLTSPLWFREYENMPIFQLLPLNTAGSLGEEVDLALVKKIEEEKQLFTCINDFANASLNDFCDSDSTNKATEEVNNKETGSKGNNVTYNDLTTDCIIKNSTNIDTTLHRHNQNYGHKVDDLSKEGTVEGKTKCTQVKPKHNIASQQGSTNTDKEVTRKNMPNPFNIVGDIIEKNVDPIITNIDNKQKTS